MLGFELRLGLGASAARAFALLGYAVEHRGSDLVIDGRAFGVDAACAGLDMLLTGLSLTVLIVALDEWRSGRVWRWWAVGGVVALGFGLVLLSNLARILTLVGLGWGAEHPGHEAVGLACFGAYVLLPIGIGVRMLGRLPALVLPGVAVPRRWGEPGPVSLDGPAPAWPVRRVVRFGFWRKPPRAVSRTGLVAALPLVVLVAGFRAFAKTDPAPPALASAPDLGGQPAVRLAHGVLGYRFADAIVYHKPVRSFYQAEHSPLICWRGSGYEFVDIRRARRPGGGAYYRASLRRGTERLETAWWMDNGRMRTLDQRVWRAEMAAGGPPFALVNVTAANPEALACWIVQLYDGPASWGVGSPATDGDEVGDTR